MGNISAIGRICQEFRPPEGLLGDSEGQETQRSVGAFGNAFLKHRFEADHITHYGELGNVERVESGYFRSLSNLCSFYGLEMPDENPLPYPFNIDRSFGNIKEDFEKKQPTMHLHLLRRENGQTGLATSKSVSTGSELLYMPIAKIYRWWKEGKYLKTVRLAMSFFAYLYHILEIPFYTDSSTYLHGSYLTIEEWLEDTEGEWEEEERQELLGELSYIRTAGEQLQKELKRKVHLDSLERRTAIYLPKTEAEKKFRSVCYRACQLRHDFSDRSLMQSMSSDLISHEDDNHLFADMQISFFWGEESDLIEENLMEQLNSYFAECGSADEARAFQFFDRLPKREEHSLEFAERALHLLDEAAFALYRL